jgi:uncharacterized membrane protein YeaQ/YmgE (transglycosylase-associated protein family)
VGIIEWLVVGLIACFIAGKIVDKSGKGLFRNIILGIVGALVGGEIFQALGHTGVTGVNLSSIVVAVVGAIVVLVLYHALTGKRAAA